MNRNIQHETVRAKRSLVPEPSDGLIGDLSPRHKRNREETDTTRMISLLKESSNSFISYLKSQNNLFWFAAAVLVATFFIVQVSVLFTVGCPEVRKYFMHTIDLHEKGSIFY